MGSAGGAGGGASGGGGATGESAEPELDAVQAPRGVYMFGGVGAGKSFLMDTFFACAPVPAAEKQRVHFHEFMLDVHKRMHELRRDDPDAGDPVGSYKFTSCKLHVTSDK